MKRWFLNLGLFVLINLVFYVVVVSIPVWSYTYTNDETESNLLIIPKTGFSKTYPVMIMGTSHARVFSRNNNHQNVEDLLNAQVINISKGGGHGGLTEEYIFLKYFYDNGNQTKTIFYFLDPWVLYSDSWNNDNYFASDEPLNAEFLISLLKSNMSWPVITNYLKSKMTWGWITTKPNKASFNLIGYPEINPALIKKTVDEFYLDGLNENTFQKYAAVINKTVDLAQKHGSQIVFIIPPTLLGEMPGEGEVKAYLDKNQFVYFDGSNEMLNKRWFYDSQHLNTEGVYIFTQYVLKPILDLENKK